MEINSVLAERESRYGNYINVSDVSQELKIALRSGRTWYGLSKVQQESLEMICNKLSRIVNGDPFYLDSWVDIVGYTQLAINTLDKPSKL